jgi:long-subunit fatty acid transport protein
MTSSRFLSTVVSLALGGFLWVGLPCSAQGQTLDDVMRYSTQLPAGGGPVAGQAGAGLSAGLAAPDALFGNPAGLGWLSASMWSGDFAVNRTESDTRFSTPDANTSADRTVSEYRLGSIAGAYSFPTTQGSFVIGASFHQSNTYGRGFDVLGDNRTNSITSTFLPATNGFEVDGEDLFFDSRRSQIAFEAGAIDFSDAAFENGNFPFFQAANPQSEAAAGQMTLEQQENLRESGQMNELSFGLATAIAPNVMLGGGLNIAFGSYTFERFYRETDVSGLLPAENPSDPEEPYDPYFLAGTSIEGFDEMQLEERIDTDLTGVNFRIGISAEPTDALRVGAHVNSPTWLNVDEVFGTEMRTFFDCDFSSGSCVRPEEPFSSGNLTGNEFSYDLRTPWRVGGGAQYSLGEVTLAGGVTFIDWTQAEVSADDASFSALNRDLEGLDATLNTRAGVEYETETVAFRTGVAYQPSPLDRSFEDINGNTVDSDQLFLSAGASISLGSQSTLHLNWLQERFDDRFTSYNSPSGAPTVREDLQRNRVLIGLTYRP